MPNQNNCKISQTVIWFLGINATLLSGGIIVMALMDKKTDAAFFALAGGSLGNLGNLIINSQGQRRSDPTGAPESPISVEATGPNAEPVKVETTPETTDAAG